MRALLSSTRGPGHFNPLVPFARALERSGHEVLVVGQPELGEAADAAGFSFRDFDPPKEDVLDEIWAGVPQLPPDEANVVVIGDIFGRLNTAAALPKLRPTFDDWRPDIVLHDPNEYAAALVADQRGIAHARVAISLASTEELSLGISMPVIDEIRRADGLGSDPRGEWLRGSPYLTVFPASFDDGAQPDTHRFRDSAWDTPPEELPDWWPGRGDQPLVYVTFGSVAGGFAATLPAYEVAMSAVAGLPARVLLTVGRDLDLDTLSEIPDNVHVEPWVPQQNVLAHAAAAVVHGGSGSTLGALAAGLPLVVVPLFADQPMNARRVAEVGVGLAVEPDRANVHAALEPLRNAVETVLTEPSYGERARAIAAEARAEPPVDEAIPLLERLGRR